MGKIQALETGLSMLWKVPKGKINPELLRYVPKQNVSANADEFIHTTQKSISAISNPNINKTITENSKIVNELLSKFQGYIGKDVNTIPAENCIELKNKFVQMSRETFVDSNDIISLKQQIPFSPSDSVEYLKLMEKLEQRIQQYPIKFELKPITQALTETSIISRYNALADTDKTIVDLLHSLKDLSPKEASIIINQSGTRYGLSFNEQIRLARMFEANNILKCKNSLSAKDIEHIAYRLHDTKDLELFGMIEQSAYKSYSDKIKQALSKAARKQIQGIEQTTQADILSKSKITNIAGHNVPVCDVNDLEHLSGFYHSPEGVRCVFKQMDKGISETDALRNQIYTRFANFRYAFNNPTNEMPVCFTYGTKDKFILPFGGNVDGFFVNIPTNSIHVGSIGDLGSDVTSLDNCIDQYINGCFNMRNNIGEMLQKGLTVQEVVSKTDSFHNEFLCSNGLIQAFYTNDIKNMNKAYLELAEKYNIPILDLKGKGNVRH